MQRETVNEILSDEERAIYEWQMSVPNFGEAGQEKLKRASVLISRAGGVGGLVAAILAGRQVIEVMYFAWVRERIGLPRERLETSATTVADLVEELRAREERYAMAFAELSSLRVALDQELSSFDAPLAGVREVAFFPPMTGG